MIPEQTNNLTEEKHGTVSFLNTSSGLWKYTIYLTPTPNVHVIFPYSTYVMYKSYWSSNLCVHVVKSLLYSLRGFW